LRTNACAIALLLGLAASAAAAEPLLREPLAIPLPGPGSGLEALLVRPSQPARYPLALISHGSPRRPQDRASMTPMQMLPQATEFARRGWISLIVMRRGFGKSGDGFGEGFGTCRDPDYLRGALASAADLRAATAFAVRRPDVDSTRIISVGRSAGGLATVALTAEPPAGLVAGISFAGGRGSQKDDEVCQPQRLVETFRTLGRRSRLPMLWVYAENDHFFGPALARDLHQAFVGAGGSAEFVMTPPFGREGHQLFSAGGIPRWTPIVDAFLQRQGLPSHAAAPTTAAPEIPPPRQLGAQGRRDFAAFLVSGPHKAFAMSSRGSYGFRTGRRTVEEAKAGALESCTRHGPDCRLIVVDDAPVP
jgi:dienelactone hydrolase